MKAKSRTRFLGTLVFILRTLVLYPALGVILSLALAFAPLWFLPNTIGDACGGPVWRDQLSFQLAYVGFVLLAMSAVVGCLIGLALAATRIFVGLFFLASQPLEEN